MLPVVGRLLKNFNFAYQPRSHAVDLVQALHIILCMLDRLNTSGMHCLGHDTVTNSAYILMYKHICVHTCRL